MTAAHERLVNLALFLASRSNPVTIEECRAAGLGYPEDADDAAFQRMFERDKEALRAAGVAIITHEDGRYSIDPERTFAQELDLSEAERSMVRALAAAFLADPSFPFAGDLAIAVAKMDLGPFPGEPSHAALALVDTETQANNARAAADAVIRKKRVRFAYTNARGERRLHEVEPYGVAYRRGGWYLVGRDVSIDQVRVYALARARGMETNRAQPKAPDFEPPEGFCVEDHLVLPFQIGGPLVEAEARFEPECAWRAPSLTEGKGELLPAEDGSVRWAVGMACPHAFAAWCVANGPGITPLRPETVVHAYRRGLESVVARHG